MKKKKIIIVIAALVVALLSVTTVVLAVNGDWLNFTKSPERNNPNPTSNPDDATDYITRKENSLGGYDYDYDVNAGTPAMSIGTIRVDSTQGYMYVYGYYYNGAGTSALSTTSLSGWALQESDVGWGCAAIKRNLATYNDPYGYIDDCPVTYYTKCYANCTNMTKLPYLPATAKHTDYVCQNCKGLTSVQINGLAVISDGAFNGCSNLVKVYLTKSVTYIGGSSSAKAPFGSVNADCILYMERDSANGITKGSYWNRGVKEVVYSADPTRFAE